MFDNGAASDQIANDGIYSRYFTKYDAKDEQVRYTMRCQVKGDDDTMFVTQKSGAMSLDTGIIGRLVRSYPIDPSNTDMTTAICCGSSTGANVETESTGNFTRNANGNSFKVVNASSATDFFPPSKVTDLKVIVDDDNVTIMFTAPGEDLDEGNATSYAIKFSEDFQEIINSTLWDNITVINEFNVVNNESLIPVESGNKVVIEVAPDVFESDKVYFVAMKATDINDNVAKISNVAQFVKVTPPPEDSGLSGGAIAGIVVGSMAGSFLLVMAGYFVYKKVA